MKKISCLIALGAFAVGVYSSRAQSNFTFTGTVQHDAPVVAWQYPDKAKPAGDRVRVAFYNIENFTDAEDDGPDRTLELAHTQASGAASLLNEINPDVMVVAEIENERSLAMLNDALAKPFPFGWITKLGDGSQDRPKLNFALLSRIPPLDLVELDFGSLNGPGRPPRGSVRATFDLGDDHRLVVYGVHLKSNYGYRPRNMHQRKNAMQLVASDAREVQKNSAATWELVLVGDCNVDPEAPEFAGDWSLKPLRNWADLWRGTPLNERTTVPTRYGDPALEFPPVCFDRIFAAGDATNLPWRVGAPGVLQSGVNTKRVGTLPGQDGHVSDHYPVWVDLMRGAPTNQP